MRSLYLLSTFASAATASYHSNLNYRSPSLSHPWLGISVHTIQKRNDPAVAFRPEQLNFTHGVASGDPSDKTVILWTRVAPIGTDTDTSNITVQGTVPLYNHDQLGYVQASKAPICVDYKVATDKALTTAVDSGRTYTSSDVDYTVKIEAQKLKAFTTYYYQFTVCNSTNKSPLGRTKTIPGKNDKLSAPVRLAVYSCSNYPFGYFSSYGNPVRKDSVDFVLHLGDYIYEYKNGDYGWGNSLGRIPLPDKEIVSLYDYRKRIATYRTDLDLVASHQQFPWISIWDDHEVADNTWKASASEMNNTEESFIKSGGVSFDQRKMNAVRAYFEWMPLKQVDMDDNLRIWRSFSIGTLLDLIMLDTRQYDRSITDLYWNTEYIKDISDEGSRSLMGARQEKWFYDSLTESANRKAAWRVIGNQIVFSRINESVAYGQKLPFDYDAWDGYLANKNRTLRHLYDNKINNTIFLSGDSHASWVSDMVWLDTHPYDPVTGNGSIGVEFAGSAVTSPCPYGANITLAAASANSTNLVNYNRELQWQDLYYRGYFELALTYDFANASFFGIPNTKVKNGQEILLAQFQVRNGENKLARNPTVGGGTAESGFLKNGKIVQTNLTVDTGK